MFVNVIVRQSSMEQMLMSMTKLTAVASRVLSMRT